MDGDPSISVRDLVQKIGNQEILRGFSLDIFQGETLVLLGKSGGGKSVFLRHLIGLMKPVSGEILFEGRDIGGLNERELVPIRRKIGMLFQDGALFDSMNVYDNVAFPLREHGERDEKSVRHKVHDALELVNMGGNDKKMPVNLSGGMRKRVALARALISEPEFLLFDEPTTGLDPIRVNAIHQLILDLHHLLHFTAVVVSHEIPEIFSLATHVAMLHEGVIVATGTPTEIQASPNPVIRQFISGQIEGPIEVN
jgi:phospholipid/cholesterol/gamma-HCH transport system ATP-binding protein